MGGSDSGLHRPARPDTASAMRRDAPNTPRSSGYITVEGEKRMRDELAQLWNVERPRVAQGVADAAAEGDRSENAEYIYGKKRLRELDRRIRFLSKRLDELTVVGDAPRATDDRVFFGAWVDVEDEDGGLATYRIVGPDETDLHPGGISMDSPVGRALLGKRVGDEVRVRRPRGEIALEIVDIRYQPKGTLPKRDDG